MGESEKPFACSFAGCNMSFTNEDHLVVHKKKHDMNLNLGTAGRIGYYVVCDWNLIYYFYSTDQTPTPTRFFKNCEEVGLFQDLQNVNPFEETFRKAVETGAHASLSETEMGLDDTLHTPHVFPHIDHDVPTNDRTVDPAESLDAEGSNKSKLNSPEITDTTTTSKILKKNVETIIIREADTSITPGSSSSSTNLSTSSEDTQLLVKIHGGHVQLSVIPVCDSSSSITSFHTHETKSQTIVIKNNAPLISPKKTRAIQANPSSSPPLSLAKMRLRQILTNSNTDKGEIQSDNSMTSAASSRKNSVESSDDEKSKFTGLGKKLETLARNRASSMRSRAKRKEWIQQLQTSANSANGENKRLRAEIAALQSEVARLKRLLLDHKDCPVTKSMKDSVADGMDKGHISESVFCGASQIIQICSVPEAIDKGINVVDKPDGACATPQIIHAVAIPVTVKRKNDVSVFANKKVASQKILLPKLDTQPGLLSPKINTVHNKPITIIHNLQTQNSKAIVHVDQSLQLINAASKTTGS